MSKISPDLRPLAYPIDKLDCLPGNPRRGDVEAVMRSYERFGQRKPIVVQRGADGRGTVEAGNHGLLAARRLGWDEIAVSWEDDDETMAKAYALADNRTGELGTMDDEALLAMLQEVGVDAELLAASSYSPRDIELLLGAPAGEVEGLTDPDAVPAVPTKAPISRLGDCWDLGLHRLVVGDSQHVEVVEETMLGAVADAVWTDPPYGVAYTGKTKKALKIVNDDLSVAQLELLLRASLGNAYRSCRGGGILVCRSPQRPARHGVLPGSGGPEGLSPGPRLGEGRLCARA